MASRDPGTSRLEIDGRSLELGDVVRVARGEIDRFVMSAAAREAMGESRRCVADVLASGATVYGVNTGFGHFASVRVGDEQLAELQLNLVRSHACGVGEPLPRPVVRALMLLRANVLAHGHSGARPEVADNLLRLLEADVCPVVPRQGSVGASGDLAPLAHVALVLIGEGEVLVDGERVDGAAALGAAGIEPLSLQAKEGLALLNGTQLMTALGVLAGHELAELCRVADVCGALTVEALGGRVDAFEPAIARLRPHPGQIAVAEHLVELLDGSELVGGSEQKVQDAYSLRCMPQVHGAARDVCASANATLAIEINAVTDNPIVLDDGRILSGGNFHGQPVAYALDALAMAAADLASIAERRINRLVNPALSGLPAFLVADGGLRSGLLITQTVAAALVNETRGLAMPSSIDSIPTSADQEDHVSMGAWCGWKARQAVENCRRVLAIELLCAGEAIELHAPTAPAPRLRPAHAWLREIVAPATSDRPFGKDITRIEKALAEGGLLECLRRR